MKILKRVQDSLNDWKQEETIHALHLILPAIDKTSKLRYPKAKPTERLEKFLKDEQEFITAFSTMGRFTVTKNAQWERGSTNWKKKDWQYWIINGVRNNLFHGDEIPEGISFNHDFGIGGVYFRDSHSNQYQGKDVFNFSKQLTLALIIVVYFQY